MDIAYESLFEHGYDLTTRTLMITGDITQESVTKAVAGLHLLKVAGPDKPIHIYLDSEGGDWHSGIGLYDYIKTIKSTVVIEVLGSAMSMASVILQAADYRMAHKHSTIMVHHGSDGQNNHVIDFENWAAHSKVTRASMCGIYSEASGRSVAYWQKKCMHDFIMTAEQALAQGLIDEVIQ